MRRRPRGLLGGRLRVNLRALDWPLSGALALLLVGVLIASAAQTDGGRVRVSDVRFRGADGAALAGLLYVPLGASAASPAPGVLAVHGYINSRETQDGFAIELARRGIVVLALDQRGHGHSQPPAFAAGYGGPDGLAWLRAQPMVDPSRIGLLGHSMGGWAALEAAKAHPGDYRAIVLVGSAPGVLGAPAASATFPRNAAVVFSRWDEFADLMWGVPSGLQVPHAPKLMAMFDSEGVGVVPERRYGDLAAGTARIYYTPATTHPGNHLSGESIGRSVDWLLGALAPQAAVVEGQRWYWKEAGTLLAMLGGVLLLAAVPLALLRTPLFASLCAVPDGRWSGHRTIAFNALLGAALYLPLFKAADTLVPLRERFPQQLTNGLLMWTIVLGLVAMAALAWQLLRRGGGVGLAWPRVPGTPHGLLRTVSAVLLGVATVAAWLAVLSACERYALLDFRFWVVAMKAPAPWHWPMLLTYAPAPCAFFLLSHAALSGLIDARTWLVDAWLRTFVAYAGGFVLFLLAQYGALLLDRPLLFGEPLLTVLAIQIVVLLAFVAFVHASCYRATGTVWLGATINGLWVSLVVVSGQATQFAVV